MLHCLPYTLGPLKPTTTPAPPPPPAAQDGLPYPFRPAPQDGLSVKICSPVAQPQLITALFADLEASASDVYLVLKTAVKLCPKVVDASQWVRLYADSEDPDCLLNTNFTFTPSSCDTSSLPLGGANPLNVDAVATVSEVHG